VAAACGLEWRGQWVQRAASFAPAHSLASPTAIDGITWKPSIHMPRAASRILLETVAVPVEQLNDCSESDAAAEGWQRRSDVSHDPQVHADAARDRYRDLWGTINGPGSWAARIRTTSPPAAAKRQEAPAGASCKKPIGLSAP
jgi:hypothetical protein